MGASPADASGAYRSEARQDHNRSVARGFLTVAEGFLETSRIDLQRKENVLNYYI